jgi:hypothetical protein
MNELKVYGFPFPRRGGLKTIQMEELPQCDYCEGEHRKAGYLVAESSEMGKKHICNQCIVDRTKAGNPVKLAAILWKKSMTP